MVHKATGCRLGASIPDTKPQDDNGAGAGGGRRSVKATTDTKREGEERHEEG